MHYKYFQVTFYFPLNLLHKFLFAKWKNNSFHFIELLWGLNKIETYSIEYV